MIDLKTLEMMLKLNKEIRVLKLTAFGDYGDKPTIILFDEGYFKMRSKSETEILTHILTSEVGCQTADKVILNMVKELVKNDGNCAVIKKLRELLNVKE